MLSFNPLKHIRVMENKFKEGDVVCAKEHPAQKLVVRRYVDRIYYCKVENDPNAKELVYFERELITEPVTETKTA